MPVPTEHHRLTWRQEDVARFLAEGATPAEIAGTLSVSLDTVRMHIRRLHVLVGTHSLQALALWAYAHLGCCIHRNHEGNTSDQG